MDDESAGPNFMSTQRLFVAIDYPDEIAERLAALDPHYRGLIFSPPAQMHLTLAFFAAVEKSTAAALEENLAAISFRSFFLPVAGLCAYSMKAIPQIVCFGVVPAHADLFHPHYRVRDDV